ncbi:DsrE family protein [Acidiphilium iwatense]|uniref:DsrE family protein n=1 Tax=Acidiphilium iwatense TaxID=768198 RepID=A0ABS9DR68_9PROT|nr:DsrE family protein [Acidiphilium iwatense]MCF3945238.1 DsrE family protein [Acidiphilium iwatense]
MTARQRLVAAFFGLAVFGFMPAGLARANPSMLKDFKFDHPIFQHPHQFATRHLVLQVSEAYPAVWTLALNNAQNVLNFMGDDKVQIVVVAYGPGLKMLLANSPDAKRIAAMDAEGIEFDACHNTMMAMMHATGHMPVLVPQAVIVPAGIVRIMQLETHGFAYIKP